MHLRCATQAEIAKAVGVDRLAVLRRIEEIVQNEQMTDLNIFRDFHQDGEGERRLELLLGDVGELLPAFGLTF